MIVTKSRAEVIQEWINSRKKNEEITRCIFHITVPQCIDINEDETIKKVKSILDKNLIHYQSIDTVDGAWNLNRNWVETAAMGCIVEYCGVYPVNWDINDIVEFEQMENNGEIVVLVYWLKNGEYVPNH